MKCVRSAQPPHLNGGVLGKGIILLKICEGEPVSCSSSRDTSECFISQLLMLKVQGMINIAVENLLTNRGYFVA